MTLVNLRWLNQLLLNFQPSFAHECTMAALCFVLVFLFVCFLAGGMHIVSLWPACLSQAGAADVRQPGRAVRQTHEHHLHLGPPRGHRLLHHCEQKHCFKDNLCSKLVLAWVFKLNVPAASSSSWTRWVSLATSASLKRSQATCWWTSLPTWWRRWSAWASWCRWRWASPWWSCPAAKPSTPCFSNSR